MTVKEMDVQTGKVTTRPYNQKELDHIAAATIEEANKKAIEDKAGDIETKREAAIEQGLMTGTSTEAVAYQTAKTQ